MFLCCNIGELSPSKLCTIYKALFNKIQIFMKTSNLHSSHWNTVVLWLQPSVNNSKQLKHIQTLTQSRLKVETLAGCNQQKKSLTHSRFMGMGNSQYTYVMWHHHETLTQSHHHCNPPLIHQLTCRNVVWIQNLWIFQWAMYYYL